MNAKRSLRTFALSLAILLSIPVGWIGYQVVTGQPIGANTLLLTDAASGSAPAVRANGQDANISINIVPKGTGTVQVNGVPLVVGTTFTSITVTGTSTLSGGALQPFGVTATPTASLKLSPLVIFHNTGDVGNGADVTEDTLHTFTVPANTLAADGQWLRWQSIINMAANADTKRTRFYFGATVIGDTTAVAFNNQSFVATCDVFRTGAAGQKAFCYTGAVPTTAAAWGAGGAGTTGGYNQTTPAEVLSGAVVMKVTGTAGVANANDIVAKTSHLTWYPQGQ